MCHAAQHELLAFKSHVDLHDSNLRDSLLVMWLLNQWSDDPKHPYSLKALARTYLGIVMSEFKDVTKGRSFDELTVEEGLDYACEDAEVAYWLHEHHAPRMADYDGMEEQYRSVELPFVRVLRHMEDTGMEIDRDFIAGYEAELRERLSPVTEEWAFLSNGINPNSGPQMQWWFKEGHWPMSASEPTKGSRQAFWQRNYDEVQWQTSRDFVEAVLRHPKTSSLGKAAAEVYLEYKEINKLLTTYMYKLVSLADQYPDGRLHCDYNHTGAATGRLSSSYPNLQNIPARTDLGKRVLQAFTSPEGYLLQSSDYSQIELRVLAHLAGRGSLADAYREGRDVHQATADLIGIPRDDGKTVNFSTVYGAGEKKMGRMLGKTKREAKGIIDRFWESYAELAELREYQVEHARAHGFVRTLGGRIRRLPNIDSGNKWLRFSEERRAFNTPIQGGARDVMTKAMVDVYQDAYSRGLIQDGSFVLCGQVHDDLLSYVREEVAGTTASLVKQGMENAMQLLVPLVTEPVQGRTWKEVK